MDQIYFDEGLAYLLKNGVSADLEFCLFSNNLTPARTTDFGDFTECAFSGYARATVELTDWNIEFVVAHVATIGAPDVTFTMNAGSSGNIYGFFVKPAAASIVLWGGRFDDAPISLTIGLPYPVSVLLGGYSATS